MRTKTEINNIETVGATVVTSKDEQTWKLHNEIHSKMNVQRIRQIPKQIFKHAVYKNGSVVALTTNFSKAKFFESKPRIIEMLCSFRDMLEGGPTGKDGIEYKKVNEFLNSI